MFHKENQYVSNDGFYFLNKSCMRVADYIIKKNKFKPGDTINNNSKGSSNNRTKAQTSRPCIFSPLPVVFGKSRS